MQVTKSSNITEPFDISKIEKVVKWATHGTKVNPSVIVNEIYNYLYDGITTKDIQQKVIKIAADKISPEEPDMQYVAARLRMFALRKEVYDGYDPCSFYSLIQYNTDIGVYDPEILQKWTKEEIDELEKSINHELDMQLSYAGAMQLIEKYLVKNRSTGKIYETPQFAYMLVGMCLHQDEPKDKRMDYVREFYKAVSEQEISLPTPIIGGVRTPTRQFSSCVLIESGDSLDSINRTSACIIKYISKRAGIGINGGAIRAEGSQIRSGEVKHTGVIPFWKHFQTAVKSCSQGGIRGGAATVFYPIWHLEVEKLLVLKNNRGVEENRIRQMDYGVQINDLMIERYLNNDYITLFSPDVADGKLYDLYFDKPEQFKELYESLESNHAVRKKRYKATELFHLFMNERASTGRIYPLFVDNVNGANSPFYEPIRQSNLCMEITLPTKPVSDNDREAGEIALCTLAAFNMGNVTIDKLQRVSRVIVRALDNLLDYQDYPVQESEKAKLRRSLGIGVTNFAYWLAKNGWNYSDSNRDKLQAVHEYFEAMQYYLVSASNELAKERGGITGSKYARLPHIFRTNERKISNYPHLNFQLKQDWQRLINDLQKYGIRNSTLTALMPSESSSQVHNATNGIEPPRGPVSVKGSKDGVFNQVVPEIENLQHQYEYAWDMAAKGNRGYLEMVAIMQKFVDQSISANTNYDPSVFPSGKVPMSVLMRDFILAWKLGLKTLYYHNTRDGADGSEETKPLPSLQDQIIEDEVCDSCTI